METTSVSALWERYDRKALPLDVTVLSQKEETLCTIKYLYFNGEGTIYGCTRIYGEYFYNKRPNGASVIVMNDADALMDRRHVDLFLKRGYHVLLLDYVGKRESKGYFTVYPEPLKLANYFMDKNCLTKTDVKLKTTCWYVWTTVMLRGITLLESFPETNPKKINVFGEKLGAFQVWKTVCVEPNVCCGIALNNSGYVDLPFSEDAEFNYQTCLNNLAYAQQCEVPVLIQISTNAEDNSLEYMNNLYMIIKNTKCKFSITERANNEIGFMQKDNIEIFMNYYNFGKSILPYYPELKPVQREHILYYYVDVDKSMDVEKIELFVSQGIENDAYKNWHSYPLDVEGEKYVAKVSVPNNKQEMQAFVNVKYKDSISVSSEIVTNIPLLMGVKSTPVTKSRLVYTADYGLDEWTSKKGIEVYDAPILRMKKGTHAISGVTSMANTLTTYKLGDPSFSGVNKNILQILFYSRKNQVITFTATAKSGKEFKDYVYSQPLYVKNDWEKLDLYAIYFKSEQGVMEDWGDVVALTIDTSDPIIVNSIIWI